MALTRKFLVALGIEAEKIDEIIDAHTATVEALKNERDTFKADVEKYKAEAEKLPAVQKELDAARKNDKSDFEQKYNDEHAAFEQYKKDVANKEMKAKKEAAYRMLLKESGISEKRIDSVVRVSDIDGVELDADGKIKNSDAMKENIKKEWADFVTTQQDKGAETNNPPGNSGGSNNGSNSRAAQLARQYHENLYGKTKED